MTLEKKRSNYAIVDACMYNRPEIVSILLEDPDINPCMSDYEAFWAAIYFGSLEVVQLLFTAYQRMCEYKENQLQYEFLCQLDLNDYYYGENIVEKDDGKETTDPYRNWNRKTVEKTVIRTSMFAEMYNDIEGYKLSYLEDRNTSFYGHTWEIYSSDPEECFLPLPISNINVNEKKEFHVTIAYLQ